MTSSVVGASSQLTSSCNLQVFKSWLGNGFQEGCGTPFFNNFVQGPMLTNVLVEALYGFIA